MGQPCGSCYGEGHVPTDEGLVTCPECGGAGVLPSDGVIVDWRAGEIERLHATGSDQAAQDTRWLIFQLRRARNALTKIFALSQEVADVAAAEEMRFIANEALGLYPIEKARAGQGAVVQDSISKELTGADSKPSR